MKKGLVLGIVLLFVITSVTPLVFGYKQEASERDEYLGNISYVNYDEYNDIEFENYREMMRGLEISDEESTNIKEDNEIYYPLGYQIKGYEYEKYKQDSANSLKFDENRYFPHKYNMSRPLESNIIYVPDDYPTIQDAVDNANTGDEIIVRSGTYVENVLVNKQLIIHSENGYNSCTIQPLDTEEPIFNLAVNSIVISGFEIEGKKHITGQIGIYLGYVDYCEIYDNYLFEMDYLIKGYESHYNIINDNVFGEYWAIQYWGIWLHGSNYNNIFNNTIRHCGAAGWGIHMQHCQSNMIFNNYFYDNNYGIICDNSDKNIILNNTFEANFHGGINIYSSYNNNLNQNIIINTYWDGIYLHSCYIINITNNKLYDNGLFVFESYENHIINNSVNDKPIIYLEDEINNVINNDSGQIILVNCENITIQNQNISGVDVGIEFWQTRYSKISDCKIYSNNFEGIYFAFSNNNQIEYTDISNSWYGIALYYSPYNEIYSNNLFENDWEGILSYNSNFNIIRKNNVYNNPISFESSNENTICYNNISNSYYGIEVKEGSVNNYFEYNNINNNEYGIYIIDSENNIINENNIQNNNVGIFIKNGGNTIEKNNFKINYWKAKFETHGGMNNWSRNYWNRPRFLPKIIFGQMGFKIIFNIDWNPALKPYDI